MKQKSRAWYEKIIEYLLKLNSKLFDLDDATLFFKNIGKLIVYLVAYVDDLMIIGKNNEYIVFVKRELQFLFDMIGFGLLHYYL